MRNFRMTHAEWAGQAEFLESKSDTTNVHYKITNWSVYFLVVSVLLL